MYRILIDTREVEEFAKNQKGVSVDVQKALTFYINQVYADLAKQHGRRYSYVTPPASNRSVLRKRSGNLLAELRDNRFVTKTGNEWSAGFVIPRGSYLYTHEGSVDASPTVIKAKGSYMTIPLRAALNPDGTPKRLSARSWSGLKRYQIGKIRSGLSGGEDSAKLNDKAWVLAKKVGRRYIPYYLLAKKVTIKKRIFVYEKMLKYYDDIYDRLDLQIQRELDRVAKK